MKTLYTVECRVAFRVGDECYEQPGDEAPLLADANLTNDPAVTMVSITGPMPPPPTPLTSRPTAVKRNSSYMDDDDDSSGVSLPFSSSAAKKLKVAFDDRVHVRIMDDWDEKSFDLVKEEVRAAITEHLSPSSTSDDARYQRLLQFLSQDPLSAEAPSGRLLIKYLRALEARVSALGECKRLVGAVLNLSWLGRDDEFAHRYTRFLLVLATAHVKFTEDILERLVACFEKLPSASRRAPGNAGLSRSQMFDRVHATIHVLIKRIPLASGLLCVAIKENSPDDSATSRAHLQYQKHILQLATEVPEVRSEILAFVVQRIVSIDVQIQRDIDELEEEEEDKLLQKPVMVSHEQDLDDSSDSDTDSDSESEMTSTEDERRLKELRLQVTKLDGSLDMLFDFYNAAFDPAMPPEANVAFDEILAHFTTLIMSHRSRHAQFLIFHFAQQSPAYATRFIQACLRIVFGNRLHTHRLTACAYLGSFLARAALVPADIVREVFSELCASLDAMRSRSEPKCIGPDRHRYGLYYTIAQTLLYIFCFRWRDLLSTPTAVDEPLPSGTTPEDLLADGRDLTWLPGIKETLTRNLHSPLNPLKVCSPAIVAEFAALAHHLRFLYVFSLLERNRRIRLGGGVGSGIAGGIGGAYAGAGEWDLGRRGTALDSKRGDAQWQLEAYFPFDPYQLPRSRRWVEREYVNWTLPEGMRRDDDDDEEDEEEDEDEDDDDEEEVEDELEIDSDGESVIEDLPSAGGSIPVQQLSIES